MVQPIRSIARTLLVPATLAAVALAGQPAASASALPGGGKVNATTSGVTHYATARGSAHRAASWPATISQAQKRWPGAKVLDLGAKAGAGRYIFKDPSGHYGLLSISTTVSPLNTTRWASHSGAVLSSYCWGCIYGVTANVSVSSFLWGNQWLDTYNGVKYGYYAWNIYATPGCSGAGSCQSPITGVIGNYTSTVNPWDNQYINYWGCCSGTTYLRAYVNLWNGVSGWAQQNP